MPEKTTDPKTTYNTNPLRQFSFVLQKQNTLLEGILNNINDRWLSSAKITYLKAAKEEGGDTDNVHYHIFVHLSKGERYSYLAGLLTPGGGELIDCKIVNTKATIEYIGNADYIYSDNHPATDKRGKKKGGKVLQTWEYGDVKTVRIPKRGGKGEDLDSRLEKMKDIIDAGGTIDDLYEADFGICIRYGKQLESYMAVVYGVRQDKTYIESLKQRSEQRAKESLVGERDALLKIVQQLQGRVINLETKQ